MIIDKWENNTLFLELLAETDNLDNDEVDDTTKTPLERPLEANGSNKRSGKITSKLSDKIRRLEGDSSLDKIKCKTDELNLPAVIVKLSSNSATLFLLKDKVVTDPAKDAESRDSMKSMEDTKLIQEDIDKNQ